MKRWLPLVLAGLLFAVPADAQERKESKDKVEVRIERMEDGKARRVEIRYRDGMPPDTTVTIMDASELEGRMRMRGRLGERRTDGENRIVIERDGGDDEDVIVIERDGDVEVIVDGDERVIRREGPGGTVRRWRPRGDVRAYRFDGSEVEMDAEVFMRDAEELHFEGERLHREGEMLRREGELLFRDGQGLRMAMPEGVFTFSGDRPFGFMGERMNVEIMEKERRSRELARQLREAEGAERDELEAQLDALLVEIFEAKQAMRAEHMAEMEERLTKLREEQRQREQQRREIIERRKRALLGEGDPLRW